MILGSEEIKTRLEQGQVFKEGTWHEDNIKEASYALKVAGDGLIIDSIACEQGAEYPETYLEIRPGRIAILSTQEELHMPPDLVGRIGIRLDFAAQGLTGLMGIQVDPYYGDDHPERLFIRVANLGNESVRLLPGAPVFNIEFNRVDGAKPPTVTKKRTWDRLLDTLRGQEQASWTFVTRVNEDLTKTSERLRNDLKDDIDNVRQGLQPVVMFGVFLVAVTILGVVLAVILGLRDGPEATVPEWVTEWGWWVLMFTLIIASLATFAIAILTGIQFLKGK